MSFCRVLVDEWVRAGVRHAVVAPGSRSTPLAIAVFERLETAVILDERSTSFTALGIGLATGVPAVLVCTSGTAATHFHGAVVEASQANVPLIVCTADRPVELQDVGAPQTIDQEQLYGSAVRWYAAPGVPDPARSHTWRPLAARAVTEAAGARPGPVHLNLAFREPLLERDGEPRPAGREDGGPWHQVSALSSPVVAPAFLADLCARSERPLVVTGHLAPDTLQHDGVPVLSDHRGPITANIAHWDLLVRGAAFRAMHEPDLVIRMGMPPASKALATWLADLDVPRISLVPPGRWIDPQHNAAWVIDTPVNLALSADPAWLADWQNAAESAAGALESALARLAALTEPRVAARVLATREPGSTLVVSSSMPVRDLESFATPRSDVRVLANRGANGIDGVTSTALGVAFTGVPTTLLIGDLAFLHDSGALRAVARHDVDLTVVVVDNDGGGIFSMLPQHDELEPTMFESLYGTPHGTDLTALCSAHGLEATTVATPEEFDDALTRAAARTGVRVVIACTDREANVGVHAELAVAVARAIRE